MAESRLPPAVQEMNGRNAGHDSGGRAINYGPEMGTPDEVEKPSYLTADASFLWDQLVLGLKGSGVLRSVDASALEQCCEAYSRWREALRMRQSEGIVIMNRFGDRVKAPWVVTEAEASVAMRQWLREFGLTPSAVSNLISRQAPDSAQDNPFVWTPDPPQ